MTIQAEEAVPLITKWRDDPVAFADEALGVSLWSKQKAALRSLAEGDTAVRSGHGVGKTRTGGVASLWWLHTRYQSRVVSTAPTWPQVENLLWAEIATLYNRARIPLGGVLLKTKLTLEEENWFAIGLSTDKPDRFTGHHAVGGVLLVYDEAAGIDQAIFEASEGALTGAGSRKLMLGNPTQAGGEFHDAFHKNRSLWRQHHISVLDTPNFTGEKVPPDVATAMPSLEWERTRRQKWGEGSVLYAIRVLGEFAKVAADSVVGLGLVETAQKRELAAGGPRTVSVDVARFGTDETVIATRVGMVARLANTYYGRDTMQTAGHVIAEYQKLVAIGGDGLPRIVVDDTGVGGAVTDRLRELGYKVDAFTAGAAPTAGEYPNQRSQVWFQFAEDILPLLDLDDDEQLLSDLVAPKWKMNSAGQRVVEPKEETKKRIGRSPDRADAMLMLFAPVDISGDEAQSGGSLW